ncbi:MAG: T9SS type A sorting domain-containing protein [Bacteroidota bacterium]|jgi:uncharacterized repeat protein (TIGR01451 family)
MKKLILLFLVLVLKFAPAKAQWVTIPDPNFVTKLTQLFPSCMNGNQMDTTCAEIVNTTILYLEYDNISNLSGIEYFTNLFGMRCNGNQLTSLPELPSSMAWLQCNLNPLTSLPPLPPNLSTLWCMNCQLTYLPPLPNSLNVLRCENNQITYIPQVPPAMQIFKIQNNYISCLQNLPYVSDSTNGDISNNPLICVPNQTNYSLGLPLCNANDTINNPNNCPSVNISGIVFKDQNNDCTLNTIDLRAQNTPIRLYDSLNNLVSTRFTYNGIYSFSGLTPNTYRVKVNTLNLPIEMGCGQNSEQLVFLDSADQNISGINFPVVCENVPYDIWCNSFVGTGWIFPGQIHTLYPRISNNSNIFNLQCDTNSYSGTVIIEVNGPITYLSPAVGALTPTVNGNVFTYTIPNINTLNPNSFGIRLLTDTTAQLGDQICLHVEISTNPMDANTTNNVYDFCYNVVNSYDPNIKQVYPQNVLPGYDDWFTYTIYFQNTGNAPAFNIRLRDTLDTQLDLNTFEILGYSHPANTTLNGNILDIRFNNIMLPDSTSNPEGSIGYYQYRIKPTPNLPNGSQIRNTAYIYFDFNAPIITNTTENNFDITVSATNLKLNPESFEIYPNPSTGIFTFKDAKNIQKVEVYNVMGQEIAVFAGDNTNKVSKQINLSNYSKGIYFAKINGSVVLKLVKE